MNRQIAGLAASLALGAAFVSLTATAGAAVTRTLQKSINVPSGDSVTVENLVGHMHVTQGNGPLQVTATVVAGGDHAQALLQSVKLDVSTTGGQVKVHVDYPVDRYDTFLYVPADAKSNGSDEVCFLGHLICFHGRSSSSFRYQGRGVRVNRSTGGGAGAPLYVDVDVRVPARLSASFSNAAGLLDADGLADNLGLVTKGGDIHAQDLKGSLDVGSGGGDVYLGDVASSDAKVHTGGGDAKLENVSDKLSLGSGGGDVTGTNLRGDLSVSTGGGDARLEGLSGKLSVHSGGGDARLSGDLSALQTLSAGTGGGDLTVSGNLSALRSVDADTGGGELTLSGNLTALTSLQAGTGGGDLHVTGDLAALASLDAESGGGGIVLRATHLSMHLDAASSGGGISVHLPGLRNVSSSSDHFSCDIGNAAGKARLRSGGGDITVVQM
ncbi:MAG TPA: DUF4097 family beta strand repeat-containing protein [Rhodanobacteraceae bacterium]|nr:DUF4097 family beta strand repeat-containing protein [Rhodanobacteraceae bacterium]